MKSSTAKETMSISTLLRRLAFCTALAAPLAAQAAGDVIRIGVLNDQSGVFADNGGLGSVTAAKLGRLRRLAARWLREHDVATRDVRLDLVGIDLSLPADRRVDHVRGVG